MSAFTSRLFSPSFLCHGGNPPVAFLCSSRDLPKFPPNPSPLYSLIFPEMIYLPRVCLPLSLKITAARSPVSPRPSICDVASSLPWNHWKVCVMMVSQRPGLAFKQIDTVSRVSICFYAIFISFIDGEEFPLSWSRSLMHTNIALLEQKIQKNGEIPCKSRLFFNNNWNRSNFPGHKGISRTVEMIKARENGPTRRSCLPLRGRSFPSSLQTNK